MRCTCIFRRAVCICGNPPEAVASCQITAEMIASNVPAHLRVARCSHICRSSMTSMRLPSCCEVTETPALRRDHALVALEVVEARLRAIVLRECGDKAAEIWANFDRAIKAARKVILGP